MRVRRSRGKKLARRRMKMVGLGMLLVILGVLFYAGIIEPRNVQLVVQDVAVPNLPKALDGLKIVQLSDLHRSALTADYAIERAVIMANDAKPDVVILTGDYVSNNFHNIAPCIHMLSKLKPRLGTYAILGNHDHLVGADAVVTALKFFGIHVLVNANAKLPGGLYLVGLDDYSNGKRDIPAALNGIPANAAKLFLAHNPMQAQLLRDQYGVIISGHTHGGQIRNPFIPGSRHPQTVAGYIDDWYLDGGMLVYVNRGIGVTNVPFRFCCRPEVTLFVLHPEPQYKH